MEKREEALRDALAKNEEETHRWESYVKDNETAIDNLNMFSKKLTVDVMVPIGRKAFMPGRLIHTNEVLVGHNQDYFSKCSAYTATEICKRRVENGKQHLEKLEAERDLFQNKLEKPHLEGVLPSSDEREIIEEYDEEKEKIWKQKHRERVKEAKLKEKQEREALMRKENAHDELMQTLDDEIEILKELNEELTDREIEPDQDTQEMVKKLLSGEMNLPPSKKRIAHTAKHNDSVQLKQVEAISNIQTEQSTINHILESPERKLNIQNNLELISDEIDSDTSIASDTPEEIRLIEKQGGYLPQGDRIGFYQYQLQIVSQKIATFTFNNNKELEEKMQLFKIRDHLEELIEILEEAALSETESQASDMDKIEEKKVSGSPPKRRISFALEDQFLEFRKNETVAQMMPIKSPTEEKPQRDIIKLDEPIFTDEHPIEPGENDANRVVDRRKTILQKVEANLKTQSPEDNDLLNKIIDSCTNSIQTLHIHFTHSAQSNVGCSDDVNTDIPASPADFYRLISTEENTEPSTNDNNNSNLKEANREKAYLDVRSEFLSPVLSEKTITEMQSKSILKNKSAVDRENHIIEPEKKPKAQNRTIKKEATRTKEEDAYLSAYDKVIGDVIENTLTAPDPLPEGKFVDMHTPKKRISRFKQIRSANK